MSGSPEVLSAIRELTTSKQLDRAELLDLLRDGIHAALARRYGPNVRFELEFDELKGAIKVVRLRQVVEAVEDESAQISLEEAQYEDPEFAIGDMLEEEVPFAEFGRLAVQAAKQRIIQRVREGERTRIRDEFASKVGELLSGEVQQIERGKLVIMLNKFREAEAIIPYREQNHREKFHQGDTIRAVLKRLEETPKGPRLILSRADPLFVKALQARGAGDPAGGGRDPGLGARGRQPDQDRRHLPRRRHRPGGRLRGPEGLAGAGGGERAGRRAHRHRALVA